MKEIATQIELLVQIVRCIHLKRELSKLDSEPHLNFWRLIHGGLLDLAVLEWTKIFGSNAEPTHWKGIVDDHQAFRNDLFRSTGLTEKEWVAYWNDLKTYRDEFVAHHSDSPSRTNFPKLDVALQSSYFYYGYLITRARRVGTTQYPDSLEKYCERFAAQTNSIAKAAIEATAKYEEGVW